MSEMRDSGVDWIGKCPASWKFLKGKYIFSLRNDRGNTIELQLLSPTQKFGVIPQSLFEELTTNTAVKVKENTDLSQFKTIHKGDFCISLRSFQGELWLNRFNGSIEGGELFLMGSDGLYKKLTGEDVSGLGSCIKSNRRAQKACENLLERVLKRGERDNISCILLNVVSGR